MVSPLPMLITVGDPLGIGPEVACRALAERIDRGEPVHAILIGDGEAIGRAAARVGLPVSEPGTGRTGGVLVVEPRGVEPVEWRSIVYATREVLAGRGAAVVTGPVHKGSIVEAGIPFTGHTELVAELCGVQTPVMGFVGGSLKVALVTTHLPLREVPDAITRERVGHVLRVVDRAMREQLGIPRPRLVVCGLNPHAGEGGSLGREELEVIGPAVEDARAEGLHCVGPISAEAAFRSGQGEGDVIVAMYHDQALAPLKLVDFGRSVNWTLGLPIIRTSVDHGTARDIAGTGQADPSSMHAAIRWAERLVAGREAARG